MLNEIERVENKHSLLYKEVDLKIAEILEQIPSMTNELLDLESLFLDVNIQSKADMYIAGYEKGRQSMANEIETSMRGKRKPWKMFVQKKELSQAK